ncbi:MAG: FHA domain-containing protein [Micrococcales bacterium]
MSDLALYIVRIAFLVVLWIFIFSIISVIRADLFGQKVVSRVTRANVPQSVSSPVLPTAPAPIVSNLPTEGGAVATKLEITGGDRKGFVVRLDRREITIGRAENSDLVISDEYASTHHAKLVLMNNDWMLQDLNSTNGTFVNDNRVGTPLVVKIGTPIRIGKTVFELRA